MVVLTLMAAALVVHLVVLSALHHRSAQQRSYDLFRYELAEGTAPVGQTDKAGHLLELGTPVALVEIPSLHVHEVVGEGTDGDVLMDGPGSSTRHATAGTGRDIGDPRSCCRLRRSVQASPRTAGPGDTIKVTTGQGVSTFTVIDKREGGDPAPPAVARGKGVSCSRPPLAFPFIPGGVLRVDADLQTQTFATPPNVIPSSILPSPEQPLGTDTSTLWALVLWLEALAGRCHRDRVVVASMGPHQTWIVLVPLAVLVSVYVVDEFMRLLPNLS